MKRSDTTFVLSILIALGVMSISHGQDVAGLPSEVVEREVAANPNSHAHRVIAGFHYFDRGQFRKAVEHFERASELQPKDAYDRAWLFMAELRANAQAPDDSLRAFLKENQTKEFIGTNIQILLGDISAADGVAMAKRTRDLGNLCEAHYFAAQRLLADGNTIEGKAHLGEAVKTQKTEYLEYKSAVSLLERINQAQQDGRGQPATRPESK